MTCVRCKALLDYRLSILGDKGTVGQENERPGAWVGCFSGLTPDCRPLFCTHAQAPIKRLFVPLSQKGKREIIIDVSHIRTTVNVTRKKIHCK